MVRADLTGADLRAAILRGAVLQLASLYGCEPGRGRPDRSDLRCHYPVAGRVPAAGVPAKSFQGWPQVDAPALTRSLRDKHLALWGGIRRLRSAE